MSYSVTIDGIEPLIQKLEAAGNGQAVRDGLEAVSLSLASSLKVYPPKPPASTYDRTMQLRNHWTYEISNDGYAAQIGNNVPYAPYVQGREQQTWFHRKTGWKTAEDTLDQRRSNIIDVMKQFLQNALNGK